MEFLIINSLFVVYILLSTYQAVAYKNNMTPDAFHHFLSHIYIATSLFIGLNMLFIYSICVPLVLAVLYLLQHIGKENKRLLMTNHWGKERRHSHWEGERRCSPKCILPLEES